MPIVKTLTGVGNIALVWLLALSIPSPVLSEEMEWIGVSPDKRGFVLAKSGRAFTPWGFNYDHDRQGRLIEDYWDAEWVSVEEDFREMKDLGANVVRIHLQLGKFMQGPDKPNEAALKQLSRLVRLSERLRIYLDLTGLACYHKQDVPEWYDELSEKDRWEVQARFWEAISQRCAGCPAVFCYDLMNEPVVPGGDKKRDDWLGPAFGDKHFVQFIALERRGRNRTDVASEWIEHLVPAIHKHDRRHLITVGMVPWSLDRPGLTSGFVPDKVAGKLDFVAVHLYPKKGQVDEAMKTLRGFSIGKPVVIEEMFPLKCGLAEFDEFIERSKTVASGWIGFYWGKTLVELQQPKTISEAITRSWLDLFQRRAKQIATANP